MPLAVTAGADRTFVTGVVTWTISSVPGGGLIRLDSTTGLAAPSVGQVTSETVLISSASVVVALQLEVAFCR